MTRLAQPNTAQAVLRQKLSTPKGIIILAVLIFLPACGSSGVTSLGTGTLHSPGPSPTLAAVTPRSGSTSGNTAVTITGTNFHRGIGVTFGGIGAASVVSVSRTHLTVVTPQGNPGPVNVVVTNSDGVSTTLAGGFTYTPPSSGTVQVIHSLPNGNPHVPYHATLVAYKGVQSLSDIVPMSNWILTAGSLPAGLSLDSRTGVIHGTPTAAGTAPFSVRGTSSGGSTATASLSIKIAARASGDPALPQTFLDTTYPDTTGYVVKTVCASGCNYATVQMAVSNVHNVGGDVNGEIIKLASGATFTENVTLPAYTMAPGKWVIITTNTSPSNLPAAGQRVNPSYAHVMAKIVTNNSSYAVGTASQANHYWLMGLEIEASSEVSTNYGIVVIDCPTAPSSASQEPSFIYIDRCYIHGNNPSDNIKRGIAANGASIAVINSYISAITNGGQDCQAIGAWNSPGPLKIVNNYLEAATENVMLGGADPSIPNLVTQDVEIRQNYMFKPLTWYPDSPTYSGVKQDVKNLFELKNANRVWVEGNVMENNWSGNQNGIAILFTPRNSSGGCNWCEVSNVTFEYNLVEHAAGGFNIGGGDTLAGPSLPSSYVAIRNNLLLDITTAWGAEEPLFLIGNTAPPPNNIILQHNTAFQSYDIILFGDTPNANYITPFTFTDNVQPHGSYGIIGTNEGIGTSSLNAYCGSTGYKVAANVIEAAGSNSMLYPKGNFFPTNWSTVFVNFNDGDYHILSSSPYHKAGTDGKDPGADIDAVVSTIAGSAP